MRRCSIAWAACGCCAVLVAGCEEKKKPAPAPSTPPEAAPSAAPVRVPVNWADVRASTDGSQIIAAKMLARHCDGWFKGGRETITLRHDGRGEATDGQGHGVAVSLEHWKGIQRDIRLAGDAYLTVAAPSRFYAQGAADSPGDGFGTIPRYKYKLETVDESTIRFRNTGKHDDGG